LITNKVRNNWKDSDVESHWDSVADIYVKENNRVKATHDQRFKESITKLAMGDQMKILNISSRDAEANDYILIHNSTVEVVNAEISFGLIKVAKELRPNAKQVKINSYSKLPFETNFFDRILTLETLEHVSEPLSFLEELYRVGKKGCRMVLSCPPDTSEPAYRIYSFLFGGHGEGPHRFLNPREVRQMFELTKWRLIEHTGTMLIPAGPVFLQNWGEKIIRRYSKTWISNMGIRQFFICERD
jgi:ubiquinone/menaquinone biosynthesis C-methylase UbiE